MYLQHFCSELDRQDQGGRSGGKQRYHSEFCMKSIVAHYDGKVSEEYVASIYKSLKEESFNAKVMSTKMDELEYGQINMSVVQYIRSFDDSSKQIFVARATIQLYNKHLSHFASIHFGLKPENDTVICIMCKNPSELKCRRETCLCRNVDYSQAHESCEEPCAHLRVRFYNYIL